MFARVLARLSTAFACAIVVDPPGSTDLEARSGICERRCEMIGRPHLFGETEALTHRGPLNTDQRNVCSPVLRRARGPKPRSPAPATPPWCCSSGYGEGKRPSLPNAK